MNILFIGDIVGKLGRKTLAHFLPSLIKQEKIDFVIANGENVTHGRGINKRHFLELKENGVDVITLGNHYDDKDDTVNFISEYNELLRPLNLKNSYPGNGTAVFTSKNGQKIRVTNVLGQAFIRMEVDKPIKQVEEIIKLDEDVIHIIDFHGEATAEKQAFAYYLDGKVTAVLGTHTHVQTNDARILPNGTAFMCDVGMCGDYDGVLGVEKESVITKMWFDHSKYYEYKGIGTGIFSAVILQIDDKTKKVVKITPLSEIAEINE